MKEIAKGVYIENAYPGVTLGAVAFDKGAILVDAPPRPEDAADWKEALAKLKTGTDRLLIHLDSHPDRTLGADALNALTMAHTETANIFEQRPNSFKMNQDERGAEWETCEGLSGIRWRKPEILFTNQAHIHWGQAGVLVVARPGPEPGACWVEIPEANVIFIGDAVTLKQPPFLALANIPIWLEQLDLLVKKPYSDYTIISSRSGKVSVKDIRGFIKYLKDIEKRLERLGKRKTDPSETEKLVDKLVSASGSPARQKNFHAQRLRYGLYHYYARNFTKS